MADDFEPLGDRVSDNENAELTIPFSPEEVGRAIASMKVGSAPGPDGLSVAFFQKFWTVIHPVVMPLFHEFYIGTLDMVRLNFGVITLIPKIVVEKPDGEEPRASPRPVSSLVGVEVTVERGHRAWSITGRGRGEGVVWSRACYDDGENRPPTSARVAVKCGALLGEVCGCEGRPGHGNWAATARER